MGNVRADFRTSQAASPSFFGPEGRLQFLALKTGCLSLDWMELSQAGIRLLSFSMPLLYFTENFFGNFPRRERTSFPSAPRSCFPLTPFPIFFFVFPIKRDSPVRSSYCLRAFPIIVCRVKLSHSPAPYPPGSPGISAAHSPPSS